MAHVSNLGLAFAEVCARFADRPALLYPADAPGQLWELGQLADLAKRETWCGAALRSGDLVAILSDKSPSGFALVLACLRLGFSPTPTSTPTAGGAAGQDPVGLSACIGGQRVSASAGQRHDRVSSGLRGPALTDLFDRARPRSLCPTRGTRQAPRQPM